MTVEVITFPEGIYPDFQRLVPDVGPGQNIGESPFTGAQNVRTFRGAERWRLEMAFTNLTGDDRAEMMAFVTRLRVSHNVFLCVNHTANNARRGTWSTGSGFRVNAGSYAGQSVVVYGGNTSVSSQARRGDFVSVNCQLKMVLEDAGTDGSGIMSLQLWPPLYDIPASGTLLRVNSPCGGFRLLNAATIHTAPPGYKTDVTISAVERINSSMVSDFL